MVDLASLIAKPFTFSVAELGSFKVDAASGDFLRWFEAWTAETDGPDGAALVRALLLTQATCTSFSPERLLSEAEVEALPPEQLDEVAFRLLETTGRLFEPSLIESSRRGAKRRVRVRRDNERYDMSLRSNEGQCDRLLRVLRDSVQDHKDHNRLLFQGTDIEEMTKAASLAAMYDPYAQQHLRMLDDMRGSAASRLGAQFAYDALKDRSLAALGTLGPTLDMATEVLRGAGALHAWAEPRDALKAALGYGAQQTSLALGLDVDNYRKLAAAASGEASYLLNLRKSYDLPFAAGALASLRALEREQIAGYAAQLLVDHQIHELLRTGWQVTASLGNYGLAERGVVGEVLRRYDDDLASGVIFPTVVEGAHAFDTTEGGPPTDRLITLLQRGLGAVVAALAATRDELRRAGLVSTLALLVALAAYANDLVNEVAETKDNERAARQQDQLERRRSAEHRELTTLLTASNRLLQQQATEREEWPSSIRFVWAAAPLRVGPERAATMMARVYPDQPVRVLETRDLWAKVEVHSYGTERPQIGWIGRSHLHLNSN